MIFLKKTKGNKTAADVINTVKTYMNEDHIAFVKKAYDFAAYVHREQKRSSGEPYVMHPIQVAGILADLKMDPETVAAGFLHDVVEDTPVTLGDIEELFGHDVAVIVDGVTKLTKIHYKSHQEQLAENHRKLLLAMSRDLRVIIVKLADRLHNMRTLTHLRPDKQRRIANETLEVYAPLANRLGISSIKWELEDTSLRYLSPQQYYRIAHLMKSKRNERVDLIDGAIKEIKESLSELDLECEIYGRPKHIYSIYRKMRDQHKQFDQIYDLLAVRVIAKSIKDCYAILGAIHTRWKPMPGRFKDYIAVPKDNMYQSLHTTVIGPKGRPFEVQIRTEEMHRVAEYGIAAHWAYKEGKASAGAMTNNGEKLNLFKEIIEMQAESTDASEFMENVKGDLFGDRVFVFTPKGDVFELPKDSVPLDLAYLIHTDLGHHTTGAKVNGRIVPLNYQIKNGDIIEILTAPNATGPSYDWLKLVRTSKARHKIKKFFKQQERVENVDKGYEMLHKLLIDEGYNPKELLKKANLEPLLEKYQFHEVDDLYGAVGYGEITAISVVNVLTQEIRSQEEYNRKLEEEQALINSEKGISKERPKTEQKKASEGILIEGIDNMLVRLSHCCNPIPGDEITGYITKGRGVSVHRVECPNAQSEQNRPRLMDVSWNTFPNKQTYYDADLQIEGHNRPGILNDILQAINNGTKHLNYVNAQIGREKVTVIDAKIGIRDKDHLQYVIDSIKRVPDVYVVRRVIH